MAYRLDIWRFKDTTEYEYKYAGRYGAAGEKRSEKKKATPEQVKKQNQINREKRIRRVIKANFKENDLWVTFKYPKGTRKTLEEATEDFRKFIRKLKRVYRKAGYELKYIYRIEIGSRGGIHMHMIINRIEGSDLMVKEAWGKYLNFTPLYDKGGYKDLAEYIVKPVNEDTGQMKLLPEEEKKISRYSTSRNLVRPVPETKIYKRRTVERLIRDGITPTEGYYVDKDSIYIGVNPYTGMSYLQYTEARIKKRGDLMRY